MKLLPISISAAAIFLTACSDKTTSTASATNTSANPTPLSAPADYANALVRGHDAAVTTTDIASLNQAVQLFNVQEGRLPKDLDELVQSKMIAHIPETPVGTYLKYDPTTGKVTVEKE